MQDVRESNSFSSNAYPRAIPVTRKDGLPRSKAIRDIIDATRFVCTLIASLFDQRLNHLELL
jgi:hypothetical protein